MSFATKAVSVMPFLFFLDILCPFQLLPGAQIEPWKAFFPYTGKRLVPQENQPEPVLSWESFHSGFSPPSMVSCFRL